MAKVLVIHGIGQQEQGPNTLHARLFPALQDGLARAGTDIAPADVTFASYGDLFRPAAEVLAPTPYYDDADVEPGFEQDLLLAMWERAADCDDNIVPPEEEVLSRTPAVARRALAALSRSRFLAGIAERAFISDLKQVSAYFRDDQMRKAIQEKVVAAVTDDTRVVVAQSLGSVVGYELLFARPHQAIRALVTRGSRWACLTSCSTGSAPAPAAVGGGRLMGAWPPVAMWANVADAGDIVAVVEDLRPLFGDRIRQLRVYNGAQAHDMSSYLTDQGTGELIAAGLDA